MSRFGWSFAGVLTLLLVLCLMTVRIRIEPATGSPAHAAPQPLFAVRDAAPAPASVASPPASPMAVSGAAPGATPAPVIQPGDWPRLVIPVEGVDFSRVADTWGAARDGGARAHHGTDIMAPAGTAVLAAAPGRIDKLYFSKGGGGISLYQRSADGQWEFYYAHLGGYMPGLAEGQTVTAGQPIAYVGDTGNAAPGVHHLHFGISRLNAGDGWWQGTPIDPYPILLAGTGQGG